LAERFCKECLRMTFIKFRKRDKYDVAADRIHSESEQEEETEVRK
jgi:hypothetical protein